MSLYFRSVEERDFPRIKQILEETWHYSEMFEEKIVADAFLDIFLTHVLQGSSYGEAAELDGEVVGAIFGRVKNQEPKLRMIQMDLTKTLKVILNASKKDQEAMDTYLDITFESYEKMMDGRDNHYDSSIELFIVDEKAQGHHIGSTLLKNLKETFIYSRAANTYLFTDTDCNFGFYDHKNFKRVGELTPSTPTNPTLDSFTYFMYAKEFEG